MTARTLGHLALYYVPGCEEAARTLFEDLGFTLIKNGPPGFYSALLDESTANHHDNLVYLSKMTDQQWAFEQDLRDRQTESDAGGQYLDFIDVWPEAAPHFSVKFEALEMLEHALAAIERDLMDGGPLHGHVSLTKFRARAGLDARVDERMSRSPVFAGDERAAFGDHIIQCFVRNDLFGLLSSASTIEIDFAFEPFFRSIPRYGAGADK